MYAYVYMYYKYNTLYNKYITFIQLQMYKYVYIDIYIYLNSFGIR